MNITVYCSSRSGVNQAYDDCARAVGQWIGANGHTLIYGGMDLGDMRIVAEAATAAGGRAIGVVPSTHRGHAWPGNFENLLPEDLNQRKDIMITLGDRFIALPGGCGTLDEILSTLSQMVFSMAAPSRRLMIVNIGGLYDPLVEQLRRMDAAGVLNLDILRRIDIVNSAEEAVRRLPDFCS